MSKKDYIAIAGIIRRAGMFNHDLATIAESLAWQFELANPSFRRELFLAACKLKGPLS